MSSSVLLWGFGTPGRCGALGTVRVDLARQIGGMTKQRIIKITCGVILAVVIVGGLMPVTVATRTTYTCTRCRAARIERTLFGFTWHRYQDTAFSDWYRGHRPTHEHQWTRFTCTRGFCIFGITTSFACGPRHPICEISPDLLREFVEHADTNTLTAFFEGVSSTNRETQNLAVQMAWNGIR